MEKSASVSIVETAKVGLDAEVYTTLRSSLFKISTSIEIYGTAGVFHTYLPNVLFTSSYEFSNSGTCLPAAFVYKSAVRPTLISS
jgi:hypothetical protein